MSRSGRAAARLLGLAALLLFAAAAGFLSRHLLHHEPPGTAHPEASRSASPPGTAVRAQSQEAPATRRVPDTLPELVLPDRDGTPHRLSEWRGHPLLVNFWATWCEPCRREIPLLMQVRREHGAEGLEVVGIAVDFPDAVRRYAHDTGMGYPILVGEDGGLAAISALGMDTVLPFTVFADAAGRIVTVKVGELRAGEVRLILDQMREARLGRISLAEARTRIASGMQNLAIERARAGATGS